MKPLCLTHFVLKYQKSVHPFFYIIKKKSDFSHVKVLVLIEYCSVLKLKCLHFKLHKETTRL